MRQLVTVVGTASAVVMGAGLPARISAPTKAVSFIGTSLALVVLDARFGDRNLVILGPGGEELVRLGTTCGRGLIDQVLEIEGEIRAIEATPSGDFQARLDIDELSLHRVAEWR